jgi:hypothetical protein
MRRRSRGHTLLRQYDLEARSSLRLPARSEAHEQAHVRLRAADVEALRRPAGEMFAPIVALFSTRDAREPVQLRANEAVYVELPGEAAEGAEAGARAEAGTRAEPGTRAEAPPRASTGAWLALRVSAHHAYVTGMRVSGVMHRSIVRLERDKTL